MRPGDWSRVLLGLTAMAPIPYVAYAEIYLNENQAADILFPGAQLKAGWMELTPSEMKSIEKASGKKVSSSRVRVWWGPDKEALIIDRVLGKHEFITYAVAIYSDGKVKGIEIMEYRETYGGQIREEEWRKQFVEKRLNDPLKLDKDIKNISGATLSCLHVTDGVRRILHTYELLKSKT